MAWPSDRAGIEPASAAHLEPLLEPVAEPRQKLFAALTALGHQPSPDTADEAYVSSFFYTTTVEGAAGAITRLGLEVVETIEVLDMFIGGENRIRSAYLVEQFSRPVFEHSVISMALPLARQRKNLRAHDIAQTLRLFEHGIKQDIAELWQPRPNRPPISKQAIDPRLTYPFRTLPS